MNECLCISHHKRFLPSLKQFRGGESRNATLLAVEQTAVLLGRTPAKTKSCEQARNTVKRRHPPLDALILSHLREKSRALHTRRTQKTTSKICSAEWRPHEEGAVTCHIETTTPARPRTRCWLTYGCVHT